MRYTSHRREWTGTRFRWLAISVLLQNKGRSEIRFVSDNRKIAKLKTFVCYKLRQTKSSKKDIFKVNIRPRRPKERIQETWWVKWALKRKRSKWTRDHDDILHDWRVKPRWDERRAQTIVRIWNRLGFIYAECNDDWAEQWLFNDFFQSNDFSAHNQRVSRIWSR